MRRSTFDKGSQPILNMATNPSFDTQGALTTIRTNGCINPSFEVSSATVAVRTNLATRPRMIDTSLGGYGSQTINYISGVTGQPDGITTAVRVSYSAGAGNPGAMVLLNPAVSTQYAVTAWVYNEGPTSETIAIALQGVSSGGSQAVAPGVWTRLEWVTTTSATASTGFGVRISSPASTGSFLVTGITAELQPTTPPTFYDGATAAAGDFTYAWTGTAGQSSSEQRAPNAQYWSPASTGVAYQSVTAPFSGTKCGAVKTKGGNGDGTYVSDIAVTATVNYTMSAYVKITTAVPNFSLLLRWKTAGGAIVSDSTVDVNAQLSIGNWVRVSATATAPATATLLQSMLRIFASHTATTFYVDNVLIEANPKVESYFDGTTAAAGDFSYAWTGTAHHTSSIQRGNSTTGVTGVNAVPISSTAWAVNGTRSLRIIPTGAATSTDSFCAPGGDTGAMRYGMEAGKTYTASAVLRQDAILTGTLRSATPVTMTAFWRVGTGSYSSKQATNLPNVIGVNRLTVTFTIPAGATEAFVRLYHGGQRGAGDVWADDFMLTEGEYAGDYVDGTKPLSKWNGTAHASTSVGYPPQLLDLAGPPSLQQAGIGNSTSPTVDGFAARTLYFVYETSDDLSSAWQTPFYYGATAPTMGLTIQTAAAGSTFMSPRLDFTGGGDINKGFTATGGRNICRRHVLAISLPQGLTSAAAHINGAVLTGLASINPGPTGWTNGQLRNHTRTGIWAVHSMVYYAEHDAATRVAISRYLGNKHGANVI